MRIALAVFLSLALVSTSLAEPSPETRQAAQGLNPAQRNSVGTPVVPSDASGSASSNTVGNTFGPTDSGIGNGKGGGGPRLGGLGGRAQSSPGVFPVQARATGPVLEAADFDVGEAVVAYNLAVLPLKTKRAPPYDDYTVLEEAQAGKKVRIREVSDDGEVSELKVKNNDERPLYLLGGEMLLGGKQDRMVVADVVIDPQREQTVPVNCVEAGRWAGRDLSFQVAPAVAHPELRQAALFQDQGSVWSEVARKSRASNVSSSTGTFRRVIQDEAVRRRIAGYLDEIQKGIPHDEQLSGVAVAINGDLAVVDLFDSPLLYAKLERKLLASYVLTAIERQPHKGRSMESVQAKAKGLKGSDVHELVTKGQDAAANVPGSRVMGKPGRAAGRSSTRARRSTEPTSAPRPRSKMRPVPRVIALFGPRRGLAREIEPRLLVGRSQDADLQLLDDKVSREHCVFEAEGGACRVRDLSSRNGTWLNDQRLASPAALAPGDRVAVGESVLVFEPSFEALLARDGASTLVLTASASASARAAPPLDGRALEKAGELALRAALAETPEGAAELVADALTRALEPSALAVLVAGPGRAMRPLLGRPAGAHLSVGRALLDDALRQGRALAQPESQSSAECDPQTTRLRARAGEVLCAPVFAGGAAGGAVCLARERPFRPEEIALAGALAQAAGAALVRSPLPSPAPDGLELPVAESPSMRESMRLATAAAQVPSTVLVLGETGTGKEELTRAIHALGPRRRGPFIALNCGAIPAELAESELFGHEKGAFTGALGAREGVFERADGGTLLLDEIGELSAAMQVKLLRVLQERSVQRVGGRGAIPVDVRVVAATHRDVEAMIRSGAFREDLYWRLNVLTIRLAPLRERREDVFPLAERFLARLSAQLGRRPEGFTAEARKALEACPWPGNARQLANAIERALVLRSSAGPVGLGDLPPEVLAPAASPVRADGANTLAELVSALEKEQVVLALKRARGVKTAAAQALGISRPTLDRKIEDYRIDLFQ